MRHLKPYGALFITVMITVAAHLRKSTVTRLELHSPHSPPRTPWNSHTSCGPGCCKEGARPANQANGAVLADDDDAPSGSSTVTSRTPGAGARPEGGASKKAISALLLGFRLTPRLAMALLCRTTCCSSQAREGWRSASWAICARSVFLGR